MSEADSPEIAYDIGGLFRVEHRDVPGRSMPYEFVRRVGATTILPIEIGLDGTPFVVTVHNNRAYYGSSSELPGGNADGNFDQPEGPYETARRELVEETGRAPANPDDIEVYLLRRISTTILYDRHFAVVRNVLYVGGELLEPHEQIQVDPTPVDEYVDGILSLSRSEIYPEINLAIARAARIQGRDAVIDWLVDGSRNDEITEGFGDWMTYVPPTHPEA